VSGLTHNAYACFTAALFKNLFVVTPT